MAENRENTETDLLSGIANGDEAAFALLVKKYWKNIYSQSLSYLKSAALAEELTQDVFMKLWQGRQEITRLKNVESYLYVICRNAVLNELRKRLQTGDTAITPDIAENLLQPDKQLEYRELYQRFLQLVETLPEKRKQVFKMSRLEGKSHDEIAASLGIHKDTVAQYIVKAMNYLRIQLSEKMMDLILIALLLKK